MENQKKCTTCKVDRSTEKYISSIGRVLKTCERCRLKRQCEHNKRKVRCVDCKGSGICDHNKRKDQCIKCNGGGICQHNKFKNYCFDCGTQPN